MCGESNRLSGPGPRRVLVTAALPYANNHLHLGHVLEFIQADIWVRYLRLRGHEVSFISAVDTHGTPIMLQAEREGRDPAEMVEAYRASHARDLEYFQVSLDVYSTTHSERARQEVESIYSKLLKAGMIKRRPVEQLYDEVQGMFLPDRLVRGGCPRCSALDQYGDNCESCGSTYEAFELQNPRSTLSESTPVLKQAEHLFFDLPRLAPALKRWLAKAQLAASVRAKLLEWWGTGLKAWDISREAPYFGFPIPGEPEKYFYVWLDAPVGYLTTSKEVLDGQAGAFELVWMHEGPVEVHHFIGKDISYFHGIFWPAMLMAAGFRCPTGLHVHGHVTIGGRKMSKSRGTFIFARDYLAHLPPEALRYYFATRLGPGVEDLNLDLEELAVQVNGELVNKVINLGSRALKLLERRFGGQLSDCLTESGPYSPAVARSEAIGEQFESRQYAQAVRQILKVADEANQFFDRAKPWLADPAPLAWAVCTESVNLFRLLMVWLSPVLPALSERALAIFEGASGWEEAQVPILSQRLRPFEHLMARLTSEDLAPLVKE